MYSKTFKGGNTCSRSKGSSRMLILRLLNLANLRQKEPQALKPELFRQFARLLAVRQWPRGNITHTFEVIPHPPLTQKNPPAYLEYSQYIKIAIYHNENFQYQVLGIQYWGIASTHSVHQSKQRDHPAVLERHQPHKWPTSRFTGSLHAYHF